MPRALVTILLTLGLCWCCGCTSPPPEFADVKGLVQLPDGTPVPNVRVIFSPVVTDTDAEHYLSSSAITDNNGRFVLHYDGTPSQTGAIVGKHKIAIQDFVQEESVGNNKLPEFRISAIYRNFHETPLSHSVKIGQQNQFTITIDPPAKDEVPPTEEDEFEDDYQDFDE